MCWYLDVDLDPMQLIESKSMYSQKHCKNICMVPVHKRAVFQWRVKLQTDSDYTTCRRSHNPSRLIVYHCRFMPRTSSYVTTFNHCRFVAIAVSDIEGPKLATRGG